MALQDELKKSINRDDLVKVIALMTAHPELHRAPIGYGEDGPLTWVAECRVPYQAPTRERLLIAKWMIENGSDVHQGGDGPLMRASLDSNRIPMMELLVAHGADVNASWHGNFPIMFAPCETLNPASLEWLLEHGSNPNCGALDYVIGTYVRRPHDLEACIKALIDAGAVSKYKEPAVLAVLRGQTDALAEQLTADPALTHRRFPELDFGPTGGRLLTLQGATLLHVAAEYGNTDAINLLLDRGADVNATATSGQTALFHAATQFDFGLPAVTLLIKRGADLSIRATVPGHYERPGETVEGTALDYAVQFPGGENATVALLRKHRGGGV